tara:strand:+ start:2260 stop:2556 length:297 start_codon:yes stop_codon:yes gene_type:complete
MGMIYGSLAYDVTGRKKKGVRRKTVSRKIGSVNAHKRNYCRRSTPEYPSVPDTVGVAPRVESPRYTGTLVRGISTMHKSNAVPVINEEEMKDIARMRR